MTIKREDVDTGRLDLSDIVDPSVPALAPVHPGEILRDEFLDPLELTAYRIAKDISVPQTRIAEILGGKRGITADTALRLGRFFGMSAEFWLNLQEHYDLEIARAEVGKLIETEVRPLVRTA